MGAMVDAARLADELRAEQEHSTSQEKAKRALESQLVELEQRLAEANEFAAKGGRNAMAKLESRIRELEIELGSVQCRTSENYKAFQKAERRVKELQFQQDEDHKNSDRMSELANKLQQKIKTYKKQIEEARSPAQCTRSIGEALLAQGRDEVLRHRLLNFYIVARQIIKGFADMVRTIKHGILCFSSSINVVGKLPLWGIIIIAFSDDGQ